MIIPKHNILNKLSLFQGLVEYKDDSLPNSIFYHKNDVIYFELEKQILYCNYTLVWYVFSEQNKYNYDETQRVIKDVVERYTNWGSITPRSYLATYPKSVERYTNWGSITPLRDIQPTRLRWKDILIGGQ